MERLDTKSMKTKTGLDSKYGQNLIFTTTKFIKPLMIIFKTLNGTDIRLIQSAEIYVSILSQDL